MKAESFNKLTLTLLIYQNHHQQHNFNDGGGEFDEN